MMWRGLEEATVSCGIAMGEPPWYPCTQARRSGRGLFSKILRDCEAGARGAREASLAYGSGRCVGLPGKDGAYARLYRKQFADADAVERAGKAAAG